MPKFDLNKTTGINNVLNAIQQVKNVNNILPITEAKELLIESIYPSRQNFYSVTELDELSNSIKELGILQPLLVSEDGNGAYEIIAGNRRYEAAKIAGLERLPCIVKQNVKPAMFIIMLVHANMFRTKTEMEQAMEVAELKKAIAILKASDKSIKGRTNEIAGQILNLSYRQVHRLDNLNKLIPEIQGLVQSERITSSCAEQFANLEESVQREIYEVLVNSGMDINRQEAAKLRAEFTAKSREMNAQSEANLHSLREQLREEQTRLQAKEQELDRNKQEMESLLSRIYEQTERDMPNQAESKDFQLNLQDKRELNKVKQALVTALQERKDIEDRYHELSRMLADKSGTLVTASANPAADAEKLINDVKRKVQLQECIGQLNLASRMYAEYKKLSHSISLAEASVDETDLLKELTKIIREFSRMVSAD